jgi:hypothetical protein
MQQVYQWLVSGEHPFKSVAVDSLSEVQQRCIDNIAGTHAMEMKGWGELLRSMTSLIRAFRDLSFHPTHPLEMIMFTAMTRTDDKRLRPHVQGQLGTTLPYYIDVIGYLHISPGADGIDQRQMLTQQQDSIEAGDRTGRLPAQLLEPTADKIIKLISQPLSSSEEDEEPRHALKSSAAAPEEI